MGFLTCVVPPSCPRPRLVSERWRGEQGEGCPSGRDVFCFLAFLGLVLELKRDLLLLWRRGESPDLGPPIGVGGQWIASLPLGHSSPSLPRPGRREANFENLLFSFKTSRRLFFLANLESFLFIFNFLNLFQSHLFFLCFHLFFHLKFNLFRLIFIFLFFLNHKFFRRFGWNRFRLSIRLKSRLSRRLDLSPISSPLKRGRDRVPPPLWGEVLGLSIGIRDLLLFILFSRRRVWIWFWILLFIVSIFLFTCRNL